MRPEEYVRRATAYITDPTRADDARRELRAHLSEAVQAGLDAGPDREAAEAGAVRLMGDPKALAWELGLAHHRHLPWRIYLTPLLALFGLHLWLVDRWGGDGGLYWVFLAVVLGLYLAPLARTGSNPLVSLILDLRAKRLWVEVRAARGAVMAGLALGFLAAALVTVVGSRYVRESRSLAEFFLHWWLPGLTAFGTAALIRRALGLELKVVWGVAILSFLPALVAISALLSYSPWADLAMSLDSWLIETPWFAIAGLSLWRMMIREGRSPSLLRSR